MNQLSLAFPPCEYSGHRSSDPDDACSYDVRDEAHDCHNRMNLCSACAAHLERRGVDVRVRE